MPNQNIHRDDGEPEIKRLLTIKDTADILKVSERHLANLSKRGQFPPPVKLGRCVRYKRDDVSRWIDGDWGPRNDPHGPDLAG